MDKSTLSTSQADSASGVPGITVDKSVEFSYEELFNATEGFSMSNKIGQGGFGAVYYAELRGEVSSMFKLLFQLHIIIFVLHLKCFALGCLQKAAIKKMDTKSSQGFLAELKVLTHVHHSNLVGDLRFFRDKANLELICLYILIV